VPAASLRVDVEGQSYLLQPSDKVIIGRDPSCRLHLPNPLVSSRHVQLHNDGSGWRATDLGSTNGTWVDGRRVGEVPVGRETRIRLALEGPEVVLRPEVPAPSVPTPALARPSVPPRAGRPPAGPPPAGPPPTVPPRAGPRPGGPPPGPPLGAPTVRQRENRLNGGSDAPGGPVLTGIHHLSDAGVRRDVLTIGRDAGNALVLTDLLVSRRHAELRHGAAGIEIVDLGSANGTYVNGRRVSSARLSEGDAVGIGRHQLRLQGEQLLEYTDTGDFTLIANDLTVQVGSGPATKTLLHHVGFTLPPRSLLAVVGPSGAGKSTMLNALTGIRPATAGSVSYAGRDLYAEFEDIRQRIGLVPQEDIWHTALSVRQALHYGAELRFPADVSKPERDARIDEVLRELGLVAQQNNKGSQLSGGQRKRTSTALELLTKPSLLFLDEPTSGLDPDLDHEVMQLLRGLANDGRTVVVVTHSTLNLHVCDLVLVLAEGGHLAYLGTPQGALDYFAAQSYSEMFSRLKSRPGPEWGQRFRGSPEYARHVMGGSARSGPNRRTDLPPLRQQTRFSQFSTLCRRYLSVIAADKAYLGILLLLPILLAAISRVVPAEFGLGLAPDDKANLRGRQLLLVLVLGSTLMGSASAVREIVKERAIYLRERSIGLSSGAYLWSKLLVLGLITAMQAVLLTVLALAGRPGVHAPLIFGATIPEVVVAMVVLTFVCAVFGLIISAYVNNADKAMPLLVLMTMIQLVLCGGLVPLNGRPVLEQVSWAVPARWGFALVASSADLKTIETIKIPAFCAQVKSLPPGATIGPDGSLPPGVVLPDGSTSLPPGTVLPPGIDQKDLDQVCNPDLPKSDPLWNHSTGTWLTDFVVLIVLGALGIVAVAVLMRRLEPKRRAGPPALTQAGRSG
jgi:ABC-type multidrug transport system ATPase subunit